MIDWIIQALKMHFSLFLNNLWISTLFWRTTSLFFLLLLVIVIKYRKPIFSFINQSKFSEHDKKIFGQCDRLMNENQFLDLTESLGTDHSYQRSQIIVLSGYIDFFIKESNQYLNKKLANANREFIEKVISLRNFIVKHFFYFPKDQKRKNSRYCLYPELNVDRSGSGSTKSMKSYNGYSEELNNLLTSAEDSHKKYRRIVKEILIV